MPAMLSIEYLPAVTPDAGCATAIQTQNARIVDRQGHPLSGAQVTAHGTLQNFLHLDSQWNRLA